MSATTASAPAATPPAEGQPAAQGGQNAAQQQQAAQLPNSSLYVGDLDRDIAEGQLYETFSAVCKCAAAAACVMCHAP